GYETGEGKRLWDAFRDYKVSESQEAVRQCSEWQHISRSLEEATGQAKQLQDALGGVLQPPTEADTAWLDVTYGNEVEALDDRLTNINAQSRPESPARINLRQGARPAEYQMPDAKAVAANPKQAFVTARRITNALRSWRSVAEQNYARAQQIARFFED